jgi:hypothetical protein
MNNVMKRKTRNVLHALAGKHDALVDQRLRENDYLLATGQTTNHVFTTVLG